MPEKNLTLIENHNFTTDQTFIKYLVTSFFNNENDKSSYQAGDEIIIDKHIYMFVDNFLLQKTMVNDEIYIFVFLCDASGENLNQKPIAIYDEDSNFIKGFFTIDSSNITDDLENSTQNVAQIFAMELLNNKKHSSFLINKEDELLFSEYVFIYNDGFLFKRTKINGERYVFIFEYGKNKLNHILTYNEKLERVDNDIKKITKITEKYFKDENEENNKFVESLIKFFKKNQDKNTIKIKNKPRFISSQNEIFALTSDKSVKIHKENISEDVFLLKIFYNGRLTQAYKVSKGTYERLQIVNVSVEELDELYRNQGHEKLKYNDLNDERQALIDHLKQFEPAQNATGTINLDEPDDTTPIKTSEGFFDKRNNRLLETYPYNFYPVMNDKNQTRYKAEHSFVGKGAFAEVVYDSFSLNLEDYDDIRIKDKPKVWKKSKLTDKAKLNIKTEVELLLSHGRFNSIFKPKYFLRLPDGRVMFDQTYFGITLKDYLRKNKLSSKVRQELASSFLESLALIHETLIHRDLKPENIFVKTIDGIPQVVIGDFGLTIKKGENDREIVGTLYYFAPETLMGIAVGQQIGSMEKKDIFAAGIILAEIFGAERRERYFKAYEQYSEKEILKDHKRFEKYYTDVTQYLQDEKITKQIKQTCGDDFDVLPLIQKMCNVSWQQRPTASEALEGYKELLTNGHEVKHSACRQ